MINLYNKLKITITNYIRYKQTVKELSSYTDRELSDIGLRRSDITQIAKANLFN